MGVLDLQQVPHRRLNLLIGEWVLVSPHRMQRPWRGKVEKLPLERQPAYDSDCYLCPGNSRAAGARNPKYASTFVFENDYPALVPEIPSTGTDDCGLLVARPEAGLCRVVCFSPRHDLAIPLMTPLELRQVVEIWIEQFRELSDIPWVRHVQIFENRGSLMGASNAHPHCQIWANASLPNQSAKELACFQDYRKAKDSCLLCDYLCLELKHGERVVCQNESFVAVVPYWATWPFETLLLSKRHLGTIVDLSAKERGDLGDILKRITTRYDNLFEVSFPYSMGFHQSPTDREPHVEWHFHAHYYPPLLRSATVQKFMVGYELLGTPQRDITPESAAARLVEVGELHYRERERSTAEKFSKGGKNRAE